MKSSKLYFHIFIHSCEHTGDFEIYTDFEIYNTKYCIDNGYNYNNR